VEETIGRMKSHQLQFGGSGSGTEEDVWSWDALHSALSRLRREIGSWNEAFFDPSSDGSHDGSGVATDETQSPPVEGNTARHMPEMRSRRTQEDTRSAGNLHEEAARQEREPEAYPMPHYLHTHSAQYVTPQPFSQSFLSFCCLPQPAYTGPSASRRPLYLLDY
jgi:hypothetical protein